MDTPHDTAHEVQNSVPLYSPDSTVGHYQRITIVSEQRLAKAQENDWDAVFALNEQYEQATAALKALATPPTVSEVEACSNYLRSALRNDQQLQKLLEPEQDRLRQAIGGLKRQTNVLQAYSAPVLNHER